MKKFLLFLITSILLGNNGFSQYTICCDQTIYSGEAISPLNLSQYAPHVEWFYSVNGGNWISEGEYGTIYDGGLLYSTTETTKFYAVATDGATYTTPSITIEVLPAFDPGEISPSKSVCSGEAVGTLGFVRQPTGGLNSFTYQWTKNGVDIPYANGVSITVSSLTTNTVYCCKVNAGAGYKNTNESVITVSSNFNQGTIGNSQDLCFNTPAVSLTNITNPSNGKPPYTYQWQYSPNGTDWSTISNAKNISYSPGTISNNSYYRREVTDACNLYSMSNTISLTVRDKLANPKTDVKNIYCKNDSVLIKIVAPLKNNNWYNADKVFLNNATSYNVGKLTKNKVLYFNSLDYKNCSTDTIKVDVLVDSVKASFRVANTAIHIGDSVQFLNLSTNASVYKWDFGAQGEKSTEMQPISFYYKIGWYDVTLWVTSPNNCSDSLIQTKAVKVVSSSFIKDALSENISIYPMPVSNTLNIEYTGNSKATASIYNLAGQVLLEQQLNKNLNSIDMSTLQAGNYILKIVNQEGTVASRNIIKQ